jgi:hypothetical protein
MTIRIMTHGLMAIGIMTVHITIIVTPTVIISAVASNDHGLSNMYSKMQVFYL